LSESRNFNVDSESLSSTLGQTAFPLKTSHGRKYFRIELSSPIGFQLLRCEQGKVELCPERASGEILNLSEGGMLLLTDSAVPQEGFVLLTLNLNKVVMLEGVLGKIKRVEPSGEGDFLVGVEFTSREELKKSVSLAQIGRLPVKVASFNSKLRDILSSYVRTTEFAS
jgi:hypothetical protein